MIHEGTLKGFNTQMNCLWFTALNFGLLNEQRLILKTLPQNHNLDRMFFHVGNPICFRESGAHMHAFNAHEIPVRRLSKYFLTIRITLFSFYTTHKLQPLFTVPQVATTNCNYLHGEMCPLKDPYPSMSQLNAPNPSMHISLKKFISECKGQVSCPEREVYAMCVNELYL